MKQILILIVIFVAVSCNIKKSNQEVRERYDFIEDVRGRVYEQNNSLQDLSKAGQLSDHNLWDYGVYTSGMAIATVNYIKSYGLYTTDNFDFLFSIVSCQEDWLSKGSEVLQKDMKYNCFLQELKKISEIENLLPQPYLQYFNDLNIKYLQ